jgi:hypothetical protein
MSVCLNVVYAADLSLCRHVGTKTCRIVEIPGDRKYRLSEIPDVTIQPTIPGVLANYCALRLYN